jgi:hypothetical protein
MQCAFQVRYLMLWECCDDVTGLSDWEYRLSKFYVDPGFIGRTLKGPDLFILLYGK